MAKILILIGAHLCTAPRPQKEALTLAQEGHDVIVRGVWFDPTLVERDRQLMAHQPYRFQPVLDFQPGRLSRLGVRLQARLARLIFQKIGQFTPALLGYGAKAMLQAALQEKADLTIVHSEAGLWVGDRLMQQGFRVGVDFEDWFSQDLLPEALSIRPVQRIKALEERLIQRCTYCLTTSHALAKALAQVYQASTPTVIYNVFPQTKFPAVVPSKPLPSLHWFSQTIGKGRGLETLFQALPLIQYPVELHLRGTCSAATQTWLESLIPLDWRSRVFLHPTVPADQLHHCIAEHDIGLALEQTSPPSRNLTITNKLFQYLQAGLAIVATDTAGQREVLSQYPAIGALVPSGDAVELAAAINYLLSDPVKLSTAKAIAQQAAQEIYNWEKQHHQLRHITQLALAKEL
ncbi:MAG: glycosyltransferase [Oculatellaceae cyanobacterium bins.114]|nr:glycosyltransferase [Oculatellaceae cyanobacterium bins.114]